MSENKNLWVGLVLGAALTTLLMFVLYKQSVPVEVVEQPVEKSVKPFVIAPKIPEVSNNVKPKAPPPATNKPPVKQVQQRPVVNSKQGESTNIDGSTVEVAAIGLPANLDLSAQELKSLSKAERKEYDAMLAAYREVRERVLRLNLEREQLQQRVDKMFEDNATMEQALGQMRKVVDQQQETKVAD